MQNCPYSGDRILTDLKSLSNPVFVNSLHQLTVNSGAIPAELLF